MELTDLITVAVAEEALSVVDKAWMLALIGLGLTEDEVIAIQDVVHDAIAESLDLFPDEVSLG